MLSGLRWFETYVPRSLVMRLIRLGEGGVESEERPVTVMFTDIVGFTAASQRLTPRDTADFLNHQFALFAAAPHASRSPPDNSLGAAVLACRGPPGRPPHPSTRP